MDKLQDYFNNEFNILSFMGVYSQLFHEIFNSYFKQIDFKYYQNFLRISMSPQRLAQYAVRGFDKVKRRKSL